LPYIAEHSAELYDVMPVVAPPDQAPGAQQKLLVAALLQAHSDERQAMFYTLLHG